MRTIIQDFEFKTIIGCLDNERITPQNVKFYVEYESREFIDYVEFANAIKEIYDECKFKFVENSLEVCFEKLKEKFTNLTFLKIKILKTEVFSNAKFGAVNEKHY